LGDFECAGALFRLVVDGGIVWAGGFEAEAEEDGLRGRIRIRLVIALGRPSFATKPIRGVASEGKASGFLFLPEKLGRAALMNSPAQAGFQLSVEQDPRMGWGRFEGAKPPDLKLALLK
jgi:hypothetical protein